MLFALEDKRLLRKKLQTKLQQARKERKVSFPGTHRRNQDFSKGGVTLCQSEGTHQIVMSTKNTVSKKGLFNYGQEIVMAFSPPVVVCLVKKGLQKGGSQTPQDPPGYALGTSKW